MSRVARALRTALAKVVSGDAMTLGVLSVVLMRYLFLSGVGHWPPFPNISEGVMVAKPPPSPIIRPDT